MSELSEFLDVKVSDIEMPTVLPSGVFKFVLTRYNIDRATNEKRTPFVRATFKPVDVIECDTDVNIGSARTVTSDFWRTPAADKIAIEFFERKLGLDVTGEETTIGSLWEEALGAEVVAEVKQGVSKKGNPFAEIVRFFRAD